MFCQPTPFVIKQISLSDAMLLIQLKLVMHCVCTKLSLAFYALKSKHDYIKRMIFSGVFKLDILWGASESEKFKV